jgi:hypothetical protein
LQYVLALISKEIEKNLNVHIIYWFFNKNII